MIKAAVIGVGNIGYHHARIYASLPHVKLVGIVDVNEKLGKQVAKEFRTNYYADTETLLKEQDIDAISIAVPTFLHKEIALKVMPFVKKLLIEKPIADTTANAKLILQMAKKYKVDLVVGYIERHNPVIAALEKIVNKNQIGHPISIVIKRVGLFPPNAQHADVITDLATHDIDLLNYLFVAKPKVIAATGGKMIHKNFDHAEILMDYSGIHCFIQTNWVTPVKIRTIAITGEKGYVEADYITQTITVHQTNLRRSFTNFKDFITKFGKPKIKIIKVKKEEPLKRELQSFLGFTKLRNNATGEEALKALLLAENAIHAINKK